MGKADADDEIMIEGGKHRSKNGSARRRVYAASLTITPISINHAAA